MIAGLAGSLLSISTETANYTLFSAEVSTQVVFFTFIGGPAFFFGPAIAAAALTAIPYQISNYTHAWPLYQGMFFMVVMLTTPAGLGGLLTDRMRSPELREQPLRMRKRLLTGLVIVAFAAVLLESVVRVRKSGLPHINLNDGWGMWALLAILLIGIAGFLLRRRFAPPTGLLNRQGHAAVRDPMRSKISAG